MKKIVAVVLALVMVLGLSTVAFADTTTTVMKAAEGYEIYGIVNNTAPVVTATDITKIVTGNVTTTVGDKTTVEYTAVAYEVAGIGLWIEVDASIADAKLVNKSGQIVTYMLGVGSIPSTTKVATAVVEAKKVADQKCGDYVADYVVVDGKNYATVGANWAVMNGKFINYGDAVVGTVPHTFADNAYSSVDKSVVSVKCTECKATWDVLTEKQVKAMAPSAYTTATTTSGTFYIATAAVADAPATDKVESAQTFDAGIAMYVGMSVMAAAGSAVVLKKKD